MISMFTVSVIATIVIGLVTENWLWSVLILTLSFFISALVASCIKEQINAYYRACHFLVACECRAQNNQRYLKNGIELRPGYLAKWVQFTAFNLRSRSKYLYFIEERIRNQELRNEEEEQVERDRREIETMINERFNESQMRAEAYQQENQP